VRRYAAVFAALVALLLAAFVVVEAFHVPVLTDPDPVLDEGGVAAAAAGVGLLVVDVVLPVPSSLVMLSHGALFGVVLGSVLSMVGAVGAALVGFAIGRRGGPALARVIPAAERDRADALLDRWGLVAVLVSRPVPMLAEAVAIVAGTSRMPAGKVAAGAALGAAPAAVLYAVAGALAASFVSGAIVFAAVIVIALVVAVVGRAIGPAGPEPTRTELPA
jgi:uncharacterized membrane protein YdjX (TVP38/TMEM64 family)